MSYAPGLSVSSASLCGTVSMLMEPPLENKSEGRSNAKGSLFSGEVIKYPKDG